MKVVYINLDTLKPNPHAGNRTHLVAGKISHTISGGERVAQILEGLKSTCPSYLASIDINDTYIHTYTHIHTYICTCIHTYTPIHTHTRIYTHHPHERQSEGESEQV